MLSKAYLLRLVTDGNQSTLDKYWKCIAVVVAAAGNNRCYKLETRILNPIEVLKTGGYF